MSYPYPEVPLQFLDLEDFFKRTVHGDEVSEAVQIKRNNTPLPNLGPSPLEYVDSPAVRYFDEETDEETQQAIETIVDEQKIEELLSNSGVSSQLYPSTFILPCYANSSSPPGILWTTSGLTMEAGPSTATSPTKFASEIKTVQSTANEAFQNSPDNFKLVKKSKNKPNKIPYHQRPYACLIDHCDRRFNHKCDLKRHCLIHTGEKPFQCHVCKRLFNRKFSLNRHIRTHTGEKPYSCDICGSKFSRNDRKTSHAKVHLRQMMTTSPTKITAGIKTVQSTATVAEYSKSSNNECGIINEGPQKTLFKSLPFKTRPSKTPYHQRPYACLIDRCNGMCSKIFQLTRHTLLLTEQRKPFQCHTCLKSFNRKAYLARHLKIHSNEKKFSCDICGRKFSRKDKKNRHAKVHLKQKMM